MNPMLTLWWFLANQREEKREELNPTSDFGLNQPCSNAIFMQCYNSFEAVHVTWSKPTALPVLPCKCLRAHIHQHIVMRMNTTQLLANISTVICQCCVYFLLPLLNNSYGSNWCCGLWLKIEKRFSSQYFSKYNTSLKGQNDMTVVLNEGSRGHRSHQESYPRANFMASTVSQRHPNQKPKTQSYWVTHNKPWLSNH